MNILKKLETDKISNIFFLHFRLALNTFRGIATVEECLSLCTQNNNCKSAAKGGTTCYLYKVGMNDGAFKAASGMDLFVMSNPEYVFEGSLIKSLN